MLAVPVQLRLLTGPATGPCITRGREPDGDTWNERSWTSRGGHPSRTLSRSPLRERSSRRRHDQPGLESDHLSSQHEPRGVRTDHGFGRQTSAFFPLPNTRTAQYMESHGAHTCTISPPLPPQSPLSHITAHHHGSRMPSTTDCSPGSGQMISVYGDENVPPSPHSKHPSQRFGFPPAPNLHTDEDPADNHDGHYEDW